MSIISDALKKASNQRRNAIRLHDEELNKIFISDAIKAKSNQKRWSFLSSVGTLIIVGFAIIVFLYNTESFFPFNRRAAGASRRSLNVIPAPQPASETPADKKSAPADARPVEVKPVLPFTLNGIIEGAGESLAMINNNILKKGDFYKGAQIIDIGSNKVTLLYDNKEITLRIK